LPLLSQSFKCNEEPKLAIAYVIFISIVIPDIKMMAMGVPALVAGIAVLLSHSLPHQIGLIMAAIAGVVAGFSVE
jgi:uncharacterized membrane-anchored protein